MQEKIKQLKQLVDDSRSILIIQADNPDGDSLGSAIALEQILNDLGKLPYMYCNVDIPSYLRYLKGWSRVSSELPKEFDLIFVVDTSSISLLDKLSPVERGIIKSKNNTVVLDHHKDVENTIDFANLVFNEPVVATGELIYNIARVLNWPVNEEARKVLAVSIMSDSLGLISSSTTANSIRVIADLVESGVNLTELDELRRESYRKSLELTKYKGRLLERIETHLDHKLAIINIPWKEIEKYSPLYNPSMLVIEDMRLIEGNAVSIALKSYDSGRITAKIRCNYGYPIASKIAEHFGGGGHDYAAGFKTTDYKNPEELTHKLIEVTNKLLEVN